MLKYKSTVSPMLQMFLNILSETARFRTYGGMLSYIYIYIYKRSIHICLHRPPPTKIHLEEQLLIVVAPGEEEQSDRKRKT